MNPSYATAAPQMEKSPERQLPQRLLSWKPLELAVVVERAQTSAAFAMALVVVQSFVSVLALDLAFEFVVLPVAFVVVAELDSSPCALIQPATSTKTTSRNPSSSGEVLFASADPFRRVHAKPLVGFLHTTNMSVPRLESEVSLFHPPMVKIST